MYNNYNKNNIRERIYSLLNNSKTKQAYSFGKSLRFSNNNKSDIFYHFYNLPSLQSNRATSLGYGKNVNIIKLIKVVVVINYIHFHHILISNIIIHQHILSV